MLEMSNLASSFYDDNMDLVINNPDNIQNFTGMTNMFALFKKLGTAINIYVSKNDKNNLNFQPYNVDNSNKLLKNPCN